ncbi:LemA family protein [Parvibium lacunae]|uniref:LemA family protein n=1 Tax=Parvibium lacunae TaxID=1888893 RepID=A0A368L218_9BURK|nr:LemA family protein [Parvibium lacunae]RCS57543.1 LemA family protein [Parvibium lacunae]
MSITTMVVLGALIALVLWLVSAYNGLVAARNRYKNAFMQIDVQLKRRYDLIPNLVETAKAYMQHERDTLEAVVKARNQAVTVNQTAASNPANSTAIQALGQAEMALGGALSRFMALAEAYPELKANDNMMQLTEELSSTENRIAFARQAYNDEVMSYNTARESFPTNLIANRYGFAPAELLQATESAVEKAAVKVSFSK